MKLNDPDLFPINCSCQMRANLNFVEGNTWICWNCSKKYEIEVPDGFEPCMSCNGSGGYYGVVTPVSGCPDCKSKGLISWTQKILK